MDSHHHLWTTPTTYIQHSIKTPFETHKTFFSKQTDATTAPVAFYCSLLYPVVYLPLHTQAATEKSLINVPSKRFYYSKWTWSKSTSNSKTHTHPFNGPFSRTTRVGRYQKGKTNLDFTEARDSEWQWHQLGHMQVCISLQTDNHASTPPLCFYRPDALPAAQPTASKHWRQTQKLVKICTV